MKLAVVGLGKLGTPYLAVLRKAGHDVIGVDANLRSVELLREGICPVDETGVQELLDAVARPIRATSDVAEALAESDGAIVIVPTPSLPDGSFDLTHVLDVVVQLGEAFRAADKDRFVVSIASTVMPGSTDGPIRAALEQAAGAVVGDRLGLVYNPEFIALGSVVHDMTHPDVVLIGETDEWSGSFIATMQASLVANDPSIARMAATNAEVAKLALNTYVTMKISFANLIGEICEKLPGGNALDVTAAVGGDSRVGRKYFKPGGSFGGPCFPRDNRAMAALATSFGLPSTLPGATDATNQRQPSRLKDRLEGMVEQGSSVAILGLAFKPGTSVAEESFGLKIASLLREAGYKITVHDPSALEAARPILGEGIRYEANLKDAVQGAAAIIMATPWPDYETLIEDVRDLGNRQVVVFDCWNVLDPGDDGPIRVISTGVYSEGANVEPKTIGASGGSR